MRRAHWDENRAINTLKQGERVNVKISPMHIFLLRDGTVISIHPTPNLIYTSPIAARLVHRDTVLRLTADPALLVQSLLDLSAFLFHCLPSCDTYVSALVADSALQVVEEYHGKLLKLEHSILMKPKMSTVKDCTSPLPLSLPNKQIQLEFTPVHVMSGDLILHKRTLDPIKTLVYGLRRYDLDRCAALVDSAALDPATGKPPKVEGFMSLKATVYLADVYDHMDHVLTSLDMFDAIAENLINFTFNVSASRRPLPLGEDGC